LVIVKDEQTAGFALIVRPPPAPQATPAIDFRLSEFFVLRNFRRLGIGRDAATLIFNRFAGQWEVTEYARNAGAVNFWRQVIRAYTRGAYAERSADGEVRQVFRSVTSPLLRA
jgi:predicted acetyltransferase